MIRYFINISTQLSILINQIFGGDQHQSISARCYQLYRNHNLKFHIIIDKLFGKDYCLEKWAHWYVRNYHVNIVEQIILVDKEKNSNHR